MEPPQPTERTSRNAATILSAALLPLLFLALVRVTYVRGAEVENDVYYHVAMADLGPQTFMARTFPATQLSVWRDAFSDKELLFHLLLSGIRAAQRSVGAAARFPYHVPTLAFTIALLVAFCATATLLGARNPFLAAWLLVLVSPFFAARMITLRPHLLSITLMLLSALAFSRAPIRSAWIWAFGFGFVFAWAYSNPHFVLLPATAFAFARFREDRVRAALLPLAAAFGVVAGFTIHPQFPNTFTIWKIQCVDVVLQSLRGGAGVYVGNELRPPDRRWLVENAAVFVIAALNCLLVARAAQSSRRLRPATFAVFGMSALMVAGVFLARRAMEYACPFTVLAFALLLADDEAIQDRIARGRWAVAFACAIGIALFLLPLSHAIGRRLRATPAIPADGFAAWARQNHLPPGTQIANLAWSDFPLLFVAAPEYHYLFGLDPMFGYAWDARRATTLEQFRSGRIRLRPIEVERLTGARYAFASYFAAPLARGLVAQGFVRVYAGRDGWVFDLLSVGPAPRASSERPQPPRPATLTR